MLPEFTKLAAAMQGPAITPEHVLAREPEQMLMLTVALHRLTVAWRADEGHALAWDVGLTDMRVEVGLSDRDARVLVCVGGGGRGCGGGRCVRGLCLLVVCGGCAWRSCVNVLM